MNLVYANYGHSHLADVLLLAIPLVLSFFLATKNRKIEILLILLMLLYIVAFVLTFSRGAFLVLPIVVLFLIFLLKPKLVRQKFLSWLIVLLPLGLIGLIGFFSLSQIGFEAKSVQPQEWLVKQLVKPEFQAKRLEYWRQALAGFAARPLTGFGWGTFELVSLRFQKATAAWSTYTHNFYLQVLVEAGIFAFLSFLIFLRLVFLQIWQAVKKVKGDAFLLGGFGAILASSLHSFLDYDWHFPAVFLLFLLILAYLLKRSQEVAGYKIFQAARHGLVVIWRPFILTLTLSLALLVFLFSQLEILSEYFYQEGDFKKALLLAPWPSSWVRQLGDKIFANNFADGEAVFRRILAFSSDPSILLWLGQKYEEHEDWPKAAVYYQQSLELNPLGNYHLYRKLGQLYIQLGEKDKRDKLYQFFAQNLEKASLKGEDKKMAKMLYQIGLDYFKEGEEEKTLFWWQKATAWAPWWSYFYIEVASLMGKRGDWLDAEAVLNQCLKYYSPRVHCQEYKNRLSQEQPFEAPGFYAEKISQIPDY